MQGIRLQALVDCRAPSPQNSKHPTESEAPVAEFLGAATDNSAGIFTAGSYAVKNRYPLVGLFLKSQ
jgi:hypothetical protein